MIQIFASVRRIRSSMYFKCFFFLFILLLIEKNGTLGTVISVSFVTFSLLRMIRARVRRYYLDVPKVLAFGTIVVKLLGSSKYIVHILGHNSMCYYIAE